MADVDLAAGHRENVENADEDVNVEEIQDRLEDVSLEESADSQERREPRQSDSGQSGNHAGTDQPGVPGEVRPPTQRSATDPVAAQHESQGQSRPESAQQSDHGANGTSEKPPFRQPERPLPSTPHTPSSRHTRTDSQSTVATTATARSSTRSSMVFVVTALETIAASKDARRRKQLGDAAQRALSVIRSSGDPTRTDPEVLFAPLHLATEANTVSIVTTALDCIGKLISYSYFSIPPDSDASYPTPLIERAIDTICDCFQGEATPVEVQLQIIKTLLAAILNDRIIVHGAGLLKAVRQTYNIFLLSKSTANQQIAQGTLTQMIGTVFERVKTRITQKAARLNISKSFLEQDSATASDPTAAESDNGLNGDETIRDVGQGCDSAQRDVPAEKDQDTMITLQSFENRKSFDDDRIRDTEPTKVTRAKSRPSPSRQGSGKDIPSVSINGEQSGLDEDEEEDEIHIKDAFLVFRAMCKLSTKTLPAEQVHDLRSQGMRSKLLSLHIIHIILHNHMVVFTSPLATLKSGNNEPTLFVQAVKQYLCLSLSRNGSSSVNRVFEVGCEIFYLMIKHLRVMLKKETEVFLKEIYLAILEKRTAPVFQKQCFLGVLERLASDARALVEIYLNYDCDRTALDNMFQRFVEHLSRLTSTPVSITSMQQQAYQEYQEKPQPTTDWATRGTLPPSLTSGVNTTVHDGDQGFPLEYAMKQQSMQALVEILRSLVIWAEQGMIDAAITLQRPDVRNSSEEGRESMDNRGGTATPNIVEGETPIPGTPMMEDDPSQLERAKQKKTALQQAIRAFNFKPKRGLKFLLKERFIPSDSPEDIARFLITTDRIGKAALGEFLGEGEEENIKIMHAFIDQMDFTKTRFVDALRRFLQSFRLPGEAQKIDRFMLKFAERYMTGNPNAFANADTAYVLAYSVIMLNTDQHSTKLKGQRMTPEAFIKNNRGINDNADLPDDYLRGIFDEIAHNEIVLEGERENAANLGLVPQPTGGLTANIGQALANVGRDLQREAYVQASEEMANKTEQLFKSLLRAQRRSSAKTTGIKFIPATSFKHVGPMLQVTWMPFLTALSGQAQDTSNLETVRTCMEGLKLAIKLACMFDLEDPRQAFVSSLARFTNLYNLSEMKAKNMEALRVLLDVAQTEGNLLKESWRDILTCISQLDRFQLISTGVDEGAIPDVLRNPTVSRTSTASSRKSLATTARSRPRAGSSAPTHYASDVAEESRSADMVRSVDRIFTNTAQLSGDAIVHFVRALTQVSWQEIQSSGGSESPRTYSLQKLVEISGYNMTRVRFEWTNIWQVLGDHFTQVGCHTNTYVVEFAIDSLRQLSMRFMEIEELPGFKFQKDFLKPFEYIIGNTTVVKVKDMVLRCLIQMIQARGENIRSGWRTMFGVFAVAAREPYESIVTLALENVNLIYDTRFGMVISQGAFADLIVCLTEFSKNAKFQRKSLQAVEQLKASIPKMLKTPECPLSVTAGTVGKEEVDRVSAGVARQPSRQTQEEQFWFPVLFAFHDVLMTGDDLEVRSRALNYLFEALIKYGKDFPQNFWDTLWRQILYPIFMVMKSRPEMTKVQNHEELSVWLSTTMIQALRSMVTLFTHYFDSLQYMLDRFLDLLALCICQENDTLARIGSNCLQSIIIQNVTKFSPEHWHQIVNAFVDLFGKTEATALFSAATTASYNPSVNGNNPPKTPGATGESTNVSDLPVSRSPAEQSGSDPMENSLGINGLSGPAESSFTTTGSRQHSATGRSTSPSKAKGNELENFQHEAEVPATPVPVTAARRRFFNQIITKCILQLLMIETVHELFSIDAVYQQIPSQELLRLMALLKKSYQFAKRFNNDEPLRKRLHREGFMKQPPNLLKQESGSASVYISILFRMYHDTSPARLASRSATEAALIPLCAEILRSYITLDEDRHQRNIVTWRPVVIDVLEGFTGFPAEDFERHMESLAPLIVGLLGREMGGDLQRALQAAVCRCFEVGLGLKIDTGEYSVPSMPPTPGTHASEEGRVNVFGTRRNSSYRGRS